MITQTIEQYTSPRCEVLELIPEGLLALTGGESTDSTATWGTENWTLE